MGVLPESYPRAFVEDKLPNSVRKISLGAIEHQTRLPVLHEVLP